MSLEVTRISILADNIYLNLSFSNAKIDIQLWDRKTTNIFSSEADSNTRTHTIALW